MWYVVLTFKDNIFRSDFLRSFMQFQQDFIDNTQTYKCVTWGHDIYTVLHGEMIIYYQKH